MDWKAELEEQIAKEEARCKASKLPGCGAQCGFGIHRLATCKAFSMNPKLYQSIDTQIAPQDDVENKMKNTSLIIITEEADHSVGILNIGSGLILFFITTDERQNSRSCTCLGLHAVICIPSDWVYIR